jgi:hypothetical protein
MGLSSRTIDSADCTLHGRGDEEVAGWSRWRTANLNCPLPLQNDLAVARGIFTVFTQKRISFYVF